MAPHRSRRGASRSSLEAFERVYRENVDAVVGHFAQRTRDPQVVADLTYETFSVAATRFTDLEQRRTPAPEWLLTIAAEVFARDPSARNLRHRGLGRDEIAELSDRIRAEQG